MSRKVLRRRCQLCAWERTGALELVDQLWALHYVAMHAGRLTPAQRHRHRVFSERESAPALTDPAITPDRVGARGGTGPETTARGAMVGTVHPTPEQTGPRP